MPASYPTSPKSFTTKTNTIDVVDASHMNTVQDEITAIETDLLSATPTYITKATTGINASALSTGTLPDGRLSGSYTQVVALTASNGTFTNVLTINSASISGALTANGANGSSGQVLTTNGSGLYWSTVSGGGGGATANSDAGTGGLQYYNGTTFGSSANLLFTGTTVAVGNSTANGTYGQVSLTLANSTSSATLNAGTLTLGTGSINSTAYTGTANNATYAFGKSEGALNVNSATTATTANNSTYAFGKSEGALNVNSATTATTANNSTYAFGKSENQLNVNSASQATNATNLNSQPGSYYTNASNITTGTLPIAQLNANVILTTSTTGINASALSTGTVPIARLDANVILTTSTTGINASALSTGTVPNGRLSGSYTGLTAITVSNTATLGRMIENFQTYANTISGTPTLTFDCTTGNLWNVTNTISSNWTANFTNLGLSNSYATAVTLVVNQGATAYLPTAVQVEGNAVTLNWQASTQPTPNANKKDVFAFSILQTGASTYLVMGQLVSF